MVLAPEGLLIWLIVGAVAGWLVGQVMAGGGFGFAGPSWRLEQQGKSKHEKADQNNRPAGGDYAQES